jgi:hypothetical protein
MILKSVITYIPASAVILSLTALAQQPSQGTAEEAKAMPMKTVAAVTADKAKARAPDRWPATTRPTLIEY